LLGAGLFALHPLQVETVAWISSRAGQLAALFTLIALLCALRPRAADGPSIETDKRGGLARASAIAAAGLFTALACLAKESGVMTPVFILVFRLCLPRMRSRSVFYSAVASAAAAGLYLVLRQSVMDGPLDQVPHHGGDRWSGILYGGYGCFYQIGLVLRPWFQNIDYQDGFFDAVPMSLVAAGAAAYFLTVVIGLALIRRFPFAAAGILFFTAAQFPTSSLAVTLRSLVNDRYLYVPLVGLAVLGGAMLNRASRHAAGDSGTAVSAAGRRIASGAAIGLLVLLGSFTASRCTDWKDGKSLWTAALRTHPGSIRARVGLSKAFLMEGNAEEALRIAVEGNRIGRPGTAVKMNACYKAVQSLVMLERFEQAENLLSQLLAEAGDPESETFRFERQAWLDLWILKAGNGRFEEAVGAAREIVRRHGRTAVHLHLLGMSLLDAGRLEEAEAVLSEATSLPDRFAEVHEHLATVYERTGRADLAERERETARRLEEANSTQPEE
jgi:tetratricopeptide (TPR) repeat protein